MDYLRTGTPLSMTGFATAAGKTKPRAAKLVAGLLAGTIMGGMPGLALAQDAAPEAGQTTAAVEQQAVVRSIAVAGAQRLEPQTILSYIRLRPGDVYSNAAGDQVIKDLYATELFSNANVTIEDGNVVINVIENPVINRIILEGNDRIKNDKILPEIRLAPRQIFTRSKVRADVARIIELYKRQGRFAATVEPKMVSLDQNRVDVVFEINEGPKSKVRQINIIGNEKFSDGDLKDEMATKETGLLTILSLTIVATLSATGLILAVGLLIAPGAIAFLLVRSFGPMLVVAVAVCMGSMLAGVYLSFYFDSAPAPTIILILTAIFLVAFIRRQALTRRATAAT